MNLNDLPNKHIQEGIDKLPEEAIDLYIQAFSGDKKAADKACDYFKRAHLADPGNPLIKVYYADCLSLAGSYEKTAEIMIGKAIQAMKMFDSVVNSNRDNINFRFMRAYHSFRLPEAFFHRTNVAIIDFEYLIERYENDPTVFSEEIYWQLLYDLGLANVKIELPEDAKEIWEKLLSKNPPKKYKKMIEEHLGNGKKANPWALRNYAAPLEEDGRRLHALAVAGNKQAVKMALEVWKQVYQANPQDPVAQAYYGSCLALSAKDVKENKTLFTDTISGLMLLNGAVDSAPDNPEILTLRGFLAYSLPEAFFELTPKAIEDFEKVKMAYEKDNSVISQELYHEILYHLGIAYNRVGMDWKAKLVWTELLMKNPDLKYQISLSGRVYFENEFTF
jgi:tetratricopeptide (TPR) repeat protein